MTIASSSYRTNAEGEAAPWLRIYFVSGWLPLLPYLLVYLLAAVAHLPVAGLLVVCRALHLLHALLLGWCLWRRMVPVEFPQLAAWAAIGSIVFLVGPYLEFPSDSWEHLARIHAWEGARLVTDHPHWRKSSYFLAFSLSPRALDWYQTGMTLLWLWQAARLATAAGAGKGTAFVAALLMFLTAGNSVFSFSRYYGLSSTLPCQIGVLAFFHVCLRLRPGAIFRGASEGALALLLVTFEHSQGLAIAALGGALILIGRWVGCSRRRAAFAAGSLALMSTAVFFWYPRSNVFDAIANPGGWLSPVHGLNLLHPASPAASQAWVVLGWLGIANLAAGVILLARGHVVGWLTIGPPAMLCLPLVAVPLTDYLLRFGDLAIFHRLLFAIPSGLALALVGEGLVRSLRGAKHGISRGLAPAAVATIALAFAVLPAGRNGFNRAWHVLAIAPDDLSLRHLPLQTAPALQDKITVVPPGLDFAFAAKRLTPLPDYALNWSSRLIVSTETFTSARRWELATQALDVAANRDRPARAFVPDPYSITSDFSLAARLSGHWLDQEVSLEHAASPEFRRAALAKGFHPSGDAQGSLLESGSAAINRRRP